MNVSVTGLSKTGALAGTASGAITGVFASGQVSGTTKTGGLVGQFNTTNNITASYSTAAVSGTTDVDGLVGDLGASAVKSSVIDSYATGPVSGSVTVGGLVGNVHSLGVVTTSYATGPVSGAGNVGGYDTDGDGLIAITTLAQLNAVRWDLDGDGVPSSGNATAYAAAFPSGEGTVCPAGRNCAGYELMADLNFDENADGQITSADATYWNGGSGWQPIGTDTPAQDSVRYNATFDGNGHTIANLFISRTTDFNGVFGVIGSSGGVQNVGVVDADISGISSTKGALAGRNDGAISNSYASATVVAGDSAGGLVGAASKLSTIHPQLRHGQRLGTPEHRRSGRPCGTPPGQPHDE